MIGRHPLLVIDPNLLLATALFRQLLDHVVANFIEVHQHGLVLGKCFDQDVPWLSHRHVASSLLHLLVADVLDSEDDHFFLNVRQISHHVVY